MNPRCWSQRWGRSHVPIVWAVSERLLLKFVPNPARLPQKRNERSLLQQRAWRGGLQQDLGPGPLLMSCVPPDGSQVPCVAPDVVVLFLRAVPPKLVPTQPGLRLLFGERTPPQALPPPRPRARTQRWERRQAPKRHQGGGNRLFSKSKHRAIHTKDRGYRGLHRVSKRIDPCSNPQYLHTDQSGKGVFGDVIKLKVFGMKSPRTQSQVSLRRPEGDLGHERRSQQPLDGRKGRGLDNCPLVPPEASSPVHTCISRFWLPEPEKGRLLQPPHL